MPSHGERAQFANASVGWVVKSKWPIPLPAHPREKSPYGFRRMAHYHPNPGKAHTWGESWRGGLNEEDVYGGVDRSRCSGDDGF
jgi:hypothetical protein